MNKIHLLRIKIRVSSVFKSLKNETSLVFSILGGELDSEIDFLGTLPQLRTLQLAGCPLAQARPNQKTASRSPRRPLLRDNSRQTQAL